MSAQYCRKEAVSMTDRFADAIFTPRALSGRGLLCQYIYVYRRIASARLCVDLYHTRACIKNDG